MRNPRRCSAALLVSFLASVLASGGLTACASTRLLRQAAELNVRGATQLAHGDLVGAEASFQVALEYNERFAEPHNNLGLVALAQGRIADARTHFRHAIARNRDFAEAWSNLGLALAREDRARNVSADAVESEHAFTEALSINPGLVEPRLNLVRALLAHGRAADALRHARRLVQLASTMAIAHSLRAEAALALGEGVEALNASAEALRIDAADGDVRMVSARVDLVRGAIDEAFATLSGLTDDPRLGRDAHALLAAAHASRGDTASALREIQAMGPGAGDHPAAARVLRGLGR